MCLRIRQFKIRETLNLLEEEFIPIGRSRGHGLEPKTKSHVMDEVDL